MKINLIDLKKELDAEHGKDYAVKFEKLIEQYLDWLAVIGSNKEFTNDFCKVISECMKESKEQIVELSKTQMAPIKERDTMSEYKEEVKHLKEVLAQTNYTIAELLDKGIENKDHIHNLQCELEETRNQLKGVQLVRDSQNTSLRNQANTIKEQAEEITYLNNNIDDWEVKHKQLSARFKTATHLIGKQDEKIREMRKELKNKYRLSQILELQQQVQKLESENEKLQSDSLHYQDLIQGMRSFLETAGFKMVRTEESEPDEEGTITVRVFNL